MVRCFESRPLHLHNRDNGSSAVYLKMPGFTKIKNFKLKTNGRNTNNGSDFQSHKFVQGIQIYIRVYRFHRWKSTELTSFLSAVITNSFSRANKVVEFMHNFIKTKETKKKGFPGRIFSLHINGSSEVFECAYTNFENGFTDFKEEKWTLKTRLLTIFIEQQKNK